MTMKRPLLFGCICLVLFITVWTSVFDSPPFYSDIPVKEGESVIIKGQLYQKEDRSYYGTEQTNLYLKSIEIIFSDTGQVSDIHPKCKIICETEKLENIPELGSFLQISGIWKPYEHAGNPGQFDSADYYGSQNIAASVKDAELQAKSQGFWLLRERLWQVRTSLQKRLYQALPEKEASILCKMLLGVNIGMDKEIKELYRRNGIVHILSISGLHITIIGMSVYRVLRKCTCPVFPAAVIGAVFLLLYGCMTGFGISACRAIGMYLIHMMGEIVGRSYDLLTAMGVLMAVMLTDNPRLIRHCGFLLSFFSVTAVGLLGPIFSFQDVNRRRGPVPQPFLIRFLLKRFGGALQGLWTSTAISMFTMPIMLYFFYEIPVYAPFVNLLVLPLMGAVMGAGILLMIFPQITFLADFEHIILNGYEKICLLFEKLPYHTWVIGRPGLWQIIVYYAGALLIVWLCNRKSKWWIIGMGALILFLSTDFARENQITFLDVGQGDCIAVMTEGKTYLFDGGSSTEKSVGEDIIVPFLKYYGIDTIDGVFISHPDSDHINGILEILEQELTEIKAVYLPDVAKERKEDFQEIIALCQRQRVTYYSAGDAVQIGELAITCLHPKKHFTGDTNTYSGCFLLENKGMNILLTGDVEGTGEELLTARLRELDVGQIHVLKAAHHGSKYSTEQEFIKQADPLLAVISCGENNRYGHPHEEVLRRLLENETQVYMTKDVGAVSIFMDRGSIKTWKVMPE